MYQTVSLTKCYNIRLIRKISTYFSSTNENILMLSQRSHGKNDVQLGDADEGLSQNQTQAPQRIWH